MPQTFRIPALLVAGVLFAVASASSAYADATYTYTGNPFTEFTGIWGCSSPSTGQVSSDTCSVTGSFTVSQALASNLFDAQITPTSWNFTDGFYVWSPGPINSFFTGSGAFVVTTDSNGDITNWGISLDLQGAATDFLLFTNNGEDFAEGRLNGNPVDAADNAAVPGTWTMTTSGSTGGTGGGGTSMPEPSSVGLLAIGLVAFAAAIRWRNRGTCGA